MTPQPPTSAPHQYSPGARRPQPPLVFPAFPAGPGREEDVWGRRGTGVTPAAPQHPLRAVEALDTPKQRWGLTHLLPWQPDGTLGAGQTLRETRPGCWEGTEGAPQPPAPWGRPHRLHVPADRGSLAVPGVPAPPGFPGGGAGRESPLVQQKISWHPRMCHPRPRRHPPAPSCPTCPTRARGSSRPSPGNPPPWSIPGSRWLIWDGCSRGAGGPPLTPTTLPLGPGAPSMPLAPCGGRREGQGDAAPQGDPAPRTMPCPG